MSETSRLEALSDGVFAIVATLLAFDLRLLDLASPGPGGGLAVDWEKLLPRLVSYLLAFGFVAVWWTSHHDFFKKVSRVDRPLMLLNWLFLMLFCLLPTVTALLGAYPRSAAAAAAFGALSAACGVANAGMRLAAIRSKAWQPHADARARTRAILRALASPAAYAAGTALGFVDARLAWAVFLAVPVYYSFPDARSEA